MFISHRYLYETNADGNQGNDASVDIEAIKNVTSISWESDMTTKCTMAGCDGQTSGKTFYEARIAPLVANARKSNVTTNGTITLSITNEEINITSDEKYYQTSKVMIGTTNGSNLVDGSKKVEIVSAPKGTILVDQNGNEIKDTSNISEFYVKIRDKQIPAKVVKP